jgi:hypothetical protein
MNALFPRNISFKGATRIFVGIYQSAILRNDSQVFSFGLNEVMNIELTISSTDSEMEQRSIEIFQLKFHIKIMM